MQEVSSSGGTHFQPERASFSGPSYHEQQMERREIHTRLRVIEENQAAIQQMLHQHQQWQDQATQSLAEIQQNQVQQNQNWDRLFSYPQFHPPH
jgi:hypothetical protein